MEMIYDHNNAELTKTDILLASIFMLIFELCKEKMGFDVIASIVTGSLWFLNIGVMLVCMRILKTTSLKYWLCLVFINLITFIILFIRVINYIN